jgi:hypothetical protein
MNRPISWCSSRGAGGEDLQREGRVALGQVLQHQLLALHAEAAAGAVHQHARQVQLVAVQAQRLRRHVGLRRSAAC